MDGTQPLLQRLHLSGCPKRTSQAGWDWPSPFAWLELLGYFWGTSPRCGWRVTRSCERSPARIRSDAPSPLHPQAAGDAGTGTGAPQGAWRISWPEKEPAALGNAGGGAERTARGLPRGRR